MIIYHKDPSGVLGTERYVLDYQCSLQDNLQRYFPDGLDTNLVTIILNGETVNPLEFDLSRQATQFDEIRIIKRQQGTEIIASIIIAIVAAAASYFLMPKPTIPNNSGEQKDSSNNRLTGQTNIARAYQAKPDIYGVIRSFPDLVKPSGSEYINNIKYIDHLMCVGIGEYDLTSCKYSETLLDNITGSEYQVYKPGDVIPEVIYQYPSDEVNGQELTPPNLSSDVIKSFDYDNFISLSANNSEVKIVLKNTMDTEYLQNLIFPVQLNYVVNADVISEVWEQTRVTNTNITYRGNLSSIVLDSDNNPVLTIRDVIFVDFHKKIYGDVISIKINNTKLALHQMGGVYTDAFVLPEEGSEIWVDLAFQRGLKGWVAMRFIYWAIDDFGNEIEDTREQYEHSVSMNTYEPQNVTVKIVPKRGLSKYAIICGRLNDGKSELSDQVKVENVFIVSRDYDFEVLDTLIYVKTKATSQATGLKELKFNVEATRKMITYHCVSKEIDYTLRPSRSFADAILTEFVLVAGRDPNELDLDALYEIDENIRQQNECLGYFDFSFDDADISLGQRIQTMCNAARVFTYRDGQKWRFVRDEVKTRPVALFNSLNLSNSSNGGTCQYKSSLPSSYDGIELEYIHSSFDDPISGNDKKAYIRLKLNREMNTITEGRCRRPYKLQLAGCRNYSQAMNRAQLECRKLLYQRMTVEDEVLQDANFVMKGDLVRWCDTYDEAIINGEISNIEGNRFFVNQKLYLSRDKHYRVSITNKGGYPSDWLAIQSHDKQSFSADFNEAYIADSVNIQMGSLFIITEMIESDPMDFILTEKQYNEGSFKISLSNYDERIYEFDKQ